MESYRNYAVESNTDGNTFPHEENRGKWGSNKEFFLACLGYTFGTLNVVYFPIACLQYGGVIFLLIYIFMLSLITAPIFFLESTIGQFSSTGFISVFRMSPYLKGIGYVFLIYNLAYSLPGSLNAAAPILGIFGQRMTYYQPSQFNFALVGCCFAVWIFIAAFITFGAQRLGKALYFTVIFPLSLLLIMTVRVGIYPGTVMTYHVIKDTFNIEYLSLYETWFQASIFAMHSVGSCMGVITTLSSFNDCRGNPEKYAWILPLTIGGLNIVSCLLLYGIIHHVTTTAIQAVTAVSSGYDKYLEQFGNLDVYHLWAIVFSLMLFFLELNKLVLTIFACVQSLFDEFIQLRNYKVPFIWLLCASMFLFSLPFCRNDYVQFIFSMRPFEELSQTLLIFLEVSVIVWMFGQKEFVKSIEFMTRHKFNEWKFIIYRLVTPATLLAKLIGHIIDVNLIFKVSHKLYRKLTEHVAVGVGLFIPPLVIIPLYFIVKSFQYRRGSCLSGIKTGVRAKAWYPAPPINREDYEYDANTQRELLRQNFA